MRSTRLFVFVCDALVTLAASFALAGAGRSHAGCAERAERVWLGSAGVAAGCDRRGADGVRASTVDAAPSARRVMATRLLLVVPQMRTAGYALHPGRILVTISGVV